MIYLITGVPGSGKSLYAVSKLLQQLLREKVKKEDGGEIERRLCIDGIPNLLLPHELMAARPEVGFGTTAKEGDKPLQAEGDGLWNWWKWCKPGDVLVCDEVQRHWRPRGLGTKPPEEIAKLETHRHYGVDFVLITQNAMLLDQNVRRLVGRHLHVRRMFGTASALVYDWDGCQTDTHRTQGATRSVFRYSKAAYKLYKSSELHTKQHQKIPLFLAFPLVVLALGAFAGPKAYDAMHRSMTGHALTAAGATPQGTQAAPKAIAPASAPSGAPAGQLPQVLPVALAGPRVRGCIVLKSRCECFADDGMRVELAPGKCTEGVERVGSVVPLDIADGGPMRSMRAFGGVPDKLTVGSERPPQVDPGTGHANVPPIERAQGR